jgi:hydrogenase maturation protease
VLVVGVGNHWRSDDAAGLAAARLLRERARDAGLARVLDVREQQGEPLGLLETWRDARAVIVLDAVRSGAVPGTVHRVDVGAGPVPAALRNSTSTHAVGVAEAIELARTLGTLPEHALVYGIEGARFEAGAGLSPAVRAALAGVVEAALRDAQALVSARAGQSRDSRT